MNLDDYEIIELRDCSINSLPAGMVTYLHVRVQDATMLS